MSFSPPIFISYLGHENIIRFCNRPFANHKEMDRILIKNHNEMVKENDIVYNLGDIGYRCSAEYVVSQIEQLNGKQILLLGNHDKPIRQAYQKGLLNNLLKTGKLTIIGNITDKTEATIKTVTINGQMMILSHYSLRSWPNAFRLSWHCFAHSHSNLKPFYRSVDVGVDNNNFYPFSFWDIKRFMDSVSVEFKEKDVETVE